MTSVKASLVKMIALTAHQDQHSASALTFIVEALEKYDIETQDVSPELVALLLTHSKIVLEELKTLRAEKAAATAVASAPKPSPVVVEGSVDIRVSYDF